MQTQFEQASNEAELRRFMNDLIGLSALPAKWNGAGPEEIARWLVDTLGGMLGLDLIYVRLNPSAHRAAVETVIATPHTALLSQPEQAGAALRGVLGEDVGTWPSHSRAHLAGAEVSIVNLPLGVRGEIGVLVAASTRAEFAATTELLLLNVVANQASIALQSAQLLDAKAFERRRTGHTLARDSDGDDRKRAEDAIAANERNLQLTIDTIPALAWSARADGYADFLNQHYQDFVGLSQEQLQGAGWTVAVHPDDLPGLIGAWESMMASGRGGDVEARLRRFDGEYRRLLFRTSPLRNELGTIIKWYGTNTDIEDRRRAEARLEGEKQLLEMIASGRALRDVLSAVCKLFEQATFDCNCGIYPIDWNGPIFQYGVAPSLPASYTEPIAGLRVSHDVAPCGIAAYEKVQVIASDIATDPRWQASAYRSHVLEHGLRAVWSTPICSLEGRILGTFCIYQRNPGTPSAHHQDLISHMTHIASIAIERSRAEAALKRSETFLAEGQRISQTGSFSWCLDTDELTFSAELTRIFEFEPDAVASFERIGDRVHPEDLALLAEKLAQIRAGRDNPEYEIRLRMPDGRVKRLRVFGRVIHHPDGRLECLGAVQDVTQRRLAEEALDRVRSELTHVTRVMSLGALTASIAHAVSQPLSGIITNANTCLRMLAADPPNVDGARETARRTIRDGNRGSEVVVRLRALFSKQTARSEAVDLNEATSEVVALLASDFHRNRISLRAELSPDLPVLGGDRVQLQQVILNLLLNASDAMSTVEDRVRLVLIKTEYDGGRVRLSVQDAGVGFATHNAETLFDAFYTTKTGGMGMGLSVSRSIIESHQGRLWCEPNVGPGATFSFSIPVPPREGRGPGVERRSDTALDR